MLPESYTAATLELSCPVLLVLGHDPPPAIADHRGIHVPFTHDEAAIASVYRAADVVAVPSLQDNLPNTAVEAHASGTPVVASAVGGMNDIVDDGVTGILTRTEDAGAFAAALAQRLDDEALRRAMGRRAREAAERRFALDRFAAAYRGLFTAVA